MFTFVSSYVLFVIYIKLFKELKFMYKLRHHTDIFKSRPIECNYQCDASVLIKQLLNYLLPCDYQYFPLSYWILLTQAVIGLVNKFNLMKKKKEFNFVYCFADNSIK